LKDLERRSWLFRYCDYETAKSRKRPPEYEIREVRTLCWLVSTLNACHMLLSAKVTKNWLYLELNLLYHRGGSHKTLHERIIELGRFPVYMRYQGGRMHSTCVLRRTTAWYRRYCALCERMREPSSEMRRTILLGTGVYSSLQTRYTPVETKAHTWQRS
jgi:hypothetical protein